VNPFALQSLPDLECERVLLRGIDEIHAAGLCKVFADGDALRFWGHGPFADLTTAQSYAAAQVRAQRNGSRFQWCIFVDEDLIGCCALAALDPRHGSATLSYVLRSDAQGHGYAREAAHGTLAFAFDGMGLARVEADTDPRHTRSIRLLEALGFQREGLLRQRYAAAGGRQDALMFGLLLEEWRALP
jgi:[ribosomal protein S5]-alanine N-acetyltransferase